MATTVGSHSVSTFATPVNGGPLDANVVRGNDNTIRSAYVAHDADTGIHVQSSTLASRPAAGTAGRKWITADTGIFKLWYDDGTTWHEVGASTIDVYVLADENLVKGDIIKVTGYNVGNGAPRVAKVSSASDVAFGIVNQTIASGAVGYVTNTGLIIDLNTNSFAIGDILYPNTSGGLTTTKPTSGNYQPVAFVLRSNSNNGVLYVEFSAPRIVERSDNTASTVVLRDASGNFSAGTITAGALTSTGLVTFASLKGTGATTVTNIINDGTMATASATTLATSASIKTYVDAQIGANNDLSEVLANGNTTGANNIIVSSGQKITTNTIDETSSGVGVTIDSVLLKDDVVNATDIETGTISANDGTQAATIANSTGVMTIASSVLTTTDINGGTVDGTTIGASVPAAATFTNITSAGTINLTGATVSNGGSVTTIDINGGTIDGTTIGGASPAAGTFTTINATDINATTFDMTNLEVTNIKAKDGTASITIADTSGNVTFSKDLIANGNITLGNATSDTITVGGSFPTGTKLRTDSGVGNTLAVSAYDVDGTAYVDLITATASNTPTLALISTGVGSMNNIAIGASTAASGAFTTLDASGDFAVATNKFTVASATGNTAVAGTLTTEGTLTSNGNTVLGNAATDTITATAQFVTGTQLKSAQSANNTLALSAYDVDGTAYVDLVKLTAGNTPTLTLTSTGTGSMDNITIGGSTAAAGSFTTLSASGNFTLGADVVLSRGAANRLDLASGDSLNVVSGDIQIGGSTVISSTSAGTLTSLTVSGDLTVDTSTLKVDSTNNRVGIETATPAYPLQVRRAGGAGSLGVSVDNAVSARTVQYFAVGDSTADATAHAWYTRAATATDVLRMSVDASGNLAVDTNTLYVDATNNRVGVGTATPSTPLHVASGATTYAAQIISTATTAYSPTTSDSVSNARLALWGGNATNSYNAIRFTNSGSFETFFGAVQDSGGTGNFVWGGYNGAAYGEWMRLDKSGNLGLGVTPGTAKCGIAGAQGSTIASNVALLIGNAGAAANTNDRIQIGLHYNPAGATPSSIVGSIITDTAGYTKSALFFATRDVTTDTAPTERARIDASGNLGVGTASPEALLHLNKATAGGEGAFIFIDNSATSTLGNKAGIRFATNSGATFSNYGSYIEAVNTDAGNGAEAITFGTWNGSARAERARITSGGNLLVGTTSDIISTARRLSVDGSGGNVAAAFKNSTNTLEVINVWNSATSGDNIFIDFDTETSVTSRGSITYNRSGGLVAYNTTSDYRAKDIIGPVEDAGETIDALQVYMGQMHGATIARPMLIAHEAQAVTPYAVTGEKDAEKEDGTPIYQQMDHSAYVPLLIAEIQSLRARVAALEA